MYRVLRLLCLLLACTTVQSFEVTSVLVVEGSEFDARIKILITGTDLADSTDLVLTLGDTTLTILEHTSTAILAEVPVDLAPGTYSLIVWSSCQQVAEVSRLTKLP